MSDNTIQSPCAPTGVVDCEPELKAAAPELYYLHNKVKQRNFIFAEVTAKGYLKYYVENLPKDGTGCPGKWLFEMAWEYFARSGIAINGIRGDWTFADNLDVVNRLTMSGQMAIEDAAKQTWAYERAGDKGFAQVVVLDTDGSPGNYKSVDVLFLP